MMIHQDGNTHEWGAGQLWDLIATMDDATNEHYSMFFCTQEGTRSSLLGVREERFTAGHMNAFAYLSRVHSGGGRFIQSANGQAAGLMMRGNFRLTERISLNVSAQAEKFLGGKAQLGYNGASFGEVELHKDGWHHQLNVGYRITMDEASSLNLSTELQSSESDKDQIALRTRFKRRF